MGRRDSSCASAAPSTIERARPGASRIDRDARAASGSAAGRVAEETADLPPPRVVIEAVEPEVDDGRFSVKRAVGDWVEVSATVFAEGHDVVSGVVLHRQEGEDWSEVALAPTGSPGNDRWAARFRVGALGVHEYSIEAWVDAFSSWRHGLARKLDAGLGVHSELLEGAALVANAAARAEAAGERDDAELLRAASARLADAARDGERARMALSPSLRDAVARHPDRTQAARYARTLRIQVERERAAEGAWYEFFPRSASREAGAHGTLRDAEDRLAYAAAMGFDVVYLPPIHPIGESYRKGKSNAPAAEPGDPGSPWAIGAAAGGHTSVHPDLGTLDDFDRFVARARELGVEVALDLAFQCSPDHPWVREHPEWFRHRPDGTIQYAENPPKKYQDIYPLDFESRDWRALWNALLEVVRFWIARGVLIFRVDNPHTKPFAFWEWLIRETRARHPEVVFLAEAFTRPAVLRHLAKLGFSQSYTYFTWRNGKDELIAYFTELYRPAVSDYLRPNLFANTPDILPEFLQTGSRAAFEIRLVLAATLSGSYGIYGPPFELCVSQALPGREEYADSEKYEVRTWDVGARDSLRPFITRINRIRRENPSLRSHGRVEFVHVDNPQILAYLRTAPDEAPPVLVVVNLDPNYAQSGFIELPLADLGLDADRTYQMHDLLGDGRYLWRGARNYVKLDPRESPAHVFRLRRHVRTERDFDYYL
ncbi:MAG TPA: alpha-1,4-glucan--maltose-1-phosphate maltosyltransferase [Candidatus Binatia bacterium]|nr:alpha-1,4-glucan--maltose-1-phosphate maltosyltransferase [Candidatus Binatia bacterium]